MRCRRSSWTGRRCWSSSPSTTTSRLGDRTEAAIKTKGLLGAKILEVTSRGDGRQEGTIPLDRTTSPYQLPDALGELATTISGLNTNQLSDSLRVVADTFSETPPELRVAVEGVARFSETLNERDAELRELLTNANKSTAVLAERSDQVVSLVADTNALLAELENQSAAIDQISGSISALSQQLQGFIAENRETMRPAIEKLNGVLTILDNRKERLQKGLKLLSSYAMSLGESVSSGPFFKNYIANLLPGQFLQPFIDVAFSDLGLDPNVLLPSERTDPQVGTAGYARDAGAVSTHRPGRRSESSAARCHYRQPRRSRVRSAWPAAARPDRLLPLPRAAARTAARRTPAGTARGGTAGAGIHPRPDAEPGDGARAR